MIRFTVYGTPVPQGSARAFVMKQANGKHRAIVTSDNKNLKSWRQELTKAAAAAMLGTYDMAPREEPLSMIVVLYFARPASRKKAKGKVTKPDGDKLLRAVFDGLEGVVYEHDAQVVDARVVKRYGLPERAEIAVGLAEQGEQDEIRSNPLRSDTLQFS